MEEVNREEILEAFGMRAQRCFGCLVAYHFKNMYLSDDATYYCEHCKDETMFHFDQFSKLLDVTKLREAQDDHHH